MVCKFYDVQTFFSDFNNILTLGNKKAKINFRFFVRYCQFFRRDVNPRFP